MLSLDLIHTLAFAGVVLFIGYGLCRWIRPLSRYNIPAPVVGGLIVVSLKRKYEKMYTTEAVGVFALYTILMALFTNPVIEAVKTIVS